MRPPEIPRTIIDDDRYGRRARIRRGDVRVAVSVEVSDRGREGERSDRESPNRCKTAVSISGNDRNLAASKIGYRNIEVPISVQVPDREATEAVGIVTRGIRDSRPERSVAIPKKDKSQVMDGVIVVQHDDVELAIRI